MSHFAVSIAEISDPVLRREAILAEAVLSELARNPESNLPKPKSGAEVRAWLDIFRRAVGMEDKPTPAATLQLTLNTSGVLSPKRVQAKVIEANAGE